MNESDTKLTIDQAYDAMIGYLDKYIKKQK
jgi:hypothetical protein